MGEAKRMERLGGLVLMTVQPGVYLGDVCALEKGETRKIHGSRRDEEEKEEQEKTRRRDRQLCARGNESLELAARKNKKNKKNEKKRADSTGGGGWRVKRLCCVSIV